jgi:hypothetical protein
MTPKEQELSKIIEAEMAEVEAMDRKLLEAQDTTRTLRMHLNALKT